MALINMKDLAQTIEVARRYRSDLPEGKLRAAMDRQVLGLFTHIATMVEEDERITARAKAEQALEDTAPSPQARLNAVLRGQWKGMVRRVLSDADPKHVWAITLERADQLNAEEIETMLDIIEKRQAEREVAEGSTSNAGDDAQDDGICDSDVQDNTDVNAGDVAPDDVEPDVAAGSRASTSVVPPRRNGSRAHTPLPPAKNRNARQRGPDRLTYRRPERPHGGNDA